MKPHAVTFRPRLETLEDRRLLAVVATTFDADADGWTVSGAVTGPTYKANGEQTPGGYMTASDNGSDTWVWVAPAKFHGDFSEDYGTYLTFDMAVADRRPADQIAGTDVWLDGGGLQLKLQTPDNPYPLSRWTSYAVRLNEAAGWTLSDGTTPATQADMVQVLSDVTDLHLRGEFQVGADTDNLDNVMFGVPPPPALSVTDVRVSEPAAGTRVAEFSVLLSHICNEPVSVDFASADGKAAAPGDYTAVGPGTLTFAPGQTRKTVDILVNADGLTENDEAFFLNLSNPVNAVLADAQGAGTVLASWTVGSTFDADAEGWTSFDRDGNVEAAVYHDTGGDPGGNLTATDVASGTTWYWRAPATFHGNFSAAYGRYLTFELTQSPSATTNQTTATDIKLEGAGQFLEFNTPAHPGRGWTPYSVRLDETAGWTDHATGLPVTDPAQFQAVLADVTDLYIRGEYYSGTDTGGLDNVTLGDLPPALSISEAVAAEPDTTNASANLHLRALGHGGQEVIAGQSLSVQYTTVKDSAASPKDFVAAPLATLTLTPGRADGWVAVTVKGDLTDEFDEDFFVRLSSPAGAVLADGKGVATILDNDLPPGVSVGDVTLAEGNAGGTVFRFAVTLSRASEKTVTLTFTTADGTALVGEDYVARSGTLTFKPGEKKQIIKVRVKGDLTVEPDETFFVNLTGATNAALTDAQGLGTITNDDGGLAPWRRKGR